MYKKLILLILPLCLCSCNSTAIKYSENSNNNVSRNIQARVDVLNQWYIENRGDFEVYENSYWAWEDNEITTKQGIDINISEINKAFTQKRETLIAIIDTDIDLYNTTLSKKAWINNDEIPGDGIDNDNNGYVDDIHGWNFCDNNNILFNENSYGIHGTHVAGLLYAEDKDTKYKGILNGYQIPFMSLKILQGENESGSVDNLMKAIIYAEKSGVQICCMSLSTQLLVPELEQIMKESNMLFVVACGNYGENIEENPIYPASFNLDNMIVVGDIRSDGEISKTSNYGEKSVDVMAPGTDIVSITPYMNYMYLSGTSCAAALVTGQAALINSCSKEKMNAVQIKKAIIKSTTYISNLEGRAVSSGIINIKKSLEQVY